MIKWNGAFPPADEQERDHQTLLARFQQTVERADIGFFRHCHEKGAGTAAKTTARLFAHKKHLVHVGIGGSSLGPEMLLTALGVEKGKRVQFLNNIDPDALAHQMTEWALPDTFFYVVSKSGTTAETMAALAIITSWLESKGVSAAKWKEHLVVCTDPQKGDLRALARELHLSCLDVPSNVGGRFSVLTDVGLFPAAWAGVNVDQLLLGAETARGLLLAKDADKNLLTRTALWIEARRLEGRTMTVLMPYSSLLKDFTAWWVQLWAESLGKEGKGLTPVMAFGATDQHSQMQLFMQGPQDKAMLMLDVAVHARDFALKNTLNAAAAKALAPFTLGQLMEAEFSGTLKALEDEKRPYIRLTALQVDAQTVGALVLYFECLTVAVGLLLNIDPFNQPGVEAGKKYANDWLTRHHP
jgi:glucose-6-phosphate isomerase